MKTPEISIPGFRGFDYSDAVECCSMDKRIFVRDCLKVKDDGLFFADAHIASSGDTLVLLIRNKRTGRHEMYDLKVRAHYMEDADRESEIVAELVEGGVKRTL